MTPLPIPSREHEASYKKVKMKTTVDPGPDPVKLFTAWNSPLRQNRPIREAKIGREGYLIGQFQRRVEFYAEKKKRTEFQLFFLIYNKRQTIAVVTVVEAINEQRQKSIQ